MCLLLFLYFEITVGTFRVKGKETIFNCLDAALKAGYRSIGTINETSKFRQTVFKLSFDNFLCILFHTDTAVIYKNEEDIGLALEILMNKYNLQRNDLFITSKLCKI